MSLNWRNGLLSDWLHVFYEHFKKEIPDFRVVKGYCGNGIISNGIADYLVHQDTLRICVDEPYCDSCLELALYDQETTGWNICLSMKVEGKWEKLYKTAEGITKDTYNAAREIWNYYCDIELPTYAEFGEGDRITLIEVPYTGEEESINFCSAGADKMFEIKVDDQYIIGNVFVSEDFYTGTGTEYPVYINWIEFLSTFRGKKLLLPTLNALHERFGELYLEASEGNEEKYERVGCTLIERDGATGLPVYKYPA